MELFVIIYIISIHKTRGEGGERVTSCLFQNPLCLDSDPHHPCQSLHNVINNTSFVHSVTWICVVNG